jgi:2-methylisocitrate lyase-like PEP mutase family enzyme
MSALADRADALRALHDARDPLVLPNAWDVASARRFAVAGAPAVGTSSAAVARSLGSEDGERMTAGEMLDAVDRMARAVDVPVSADLEAGYGLDATALVAGLLGAGAVGCNLEDTDHARWGLRDVGDQAAWLTEVKLAGREAGVDLVLNARIDVHLRGATLEEGLERARAYRTAGADCVYPIGVRSEDAIAAYVAAGQRVNVLALPDGPPLARLRALGVVRVSFGAGLAELALAAAELAWREFAAQV